VALLVSDVNRSRPRLGATPAVYSRVATFASLPA
jgi:hypothetical protein